MYTCTRSLRDSPAKANGTTSHASLRFGMCTHPTQPKPIYDKHLPEARKTRSIVVDE